MPMRLRHVAALGAALAAAGLAVPVTAATALASTPAQPTPKPVQVVAVACPMVRLMQTWPVPRPVKHPVKREVVVKGRPLAPCCAPFLLHVKAVKVKHPVRIKLRKGMPVAIARPFGCQSLTFDLPSGASTATEVHGPRLHAHEPVFYHGRIYVIESVSGRTFTLDYRGRLFVNNGAAIDDGRAYVLAPAAFIQLVPAPAPPS
jgi:hypothetical protein